MSGSQQFKMMKNVTESLAERSRDIVEISYDQVWQTIQRGSMPELVINKDFDWQMFYGAYVKTYLARNVGISSPTAEHWLSILVIANIVYLLKPYTNNRIKRTIKTPKLYFLDTGLAAYLTRWNTPDVLKNGAVAGAFFESFLIGEIIKSYYNKGVLEPPLYFYRDKDMNEIDLLIEEMEHCIL